MSTAAKTFRLGDAGGYSVRAIGYAPTRQGNKPIYDVIQLWSDVLDELLFDVPLTGKNAVDACAAINAAGALDTEDAAFLCGLIENAFKHRNMT